MFCRIGIPLLINKFNYTLKFNRSVLKKLKYVSQTGAIFTRPRRCVEQTQIRRVATERDDQMYNIDFNKSADTLRMKSTSDVARAAFVLTFCSVNILVDNSLKLMELCRRLCSKSIYEKLLKGTFYGMFVAGETMTEVKKTVDMLQLAGVKVMFAIPCEEDLGAAKHSEPHYDRNVKSLCEILDISETTCTNPRFSHFKISGFIRSPVLVALSKHLSNHGYGGGVNEEGSVRQLTEALKHPESLPDLSFLSSEDNEHLRNSLHRLYTIGQSVVTRDIRLFVDAEFIYMRDAINALTLGMMGNFNIKEPYIWNTYQCYLKDTRQVVEEDVKIAERNGFLFATKIVRGAYMERERALAKTNGDEDPVLPNYQATTDNYYRVMEYLYNKANQSGHKLMIATHDDESIKYAVKRMAEMGVQRQNVIFGQVLGINDPLTLLLGRNHFPVYKSVPCGSIEETLPYLSRRAMENRSVLQGIRNERKIYINELLRRLNPFSD